MALTFGFTDRDPKYRIPLHTQSTLLVSAFYLMLPFRCCIIVHGSLAEEVKGTGVTVTAFCPGPTATGFDKAADMEKDSNMFRHAASAEKVAKAGYIAMMRGQAVSYHGAFTKAMNIGSRLVPRSVSRKFARKMNG